MIRKAFAMSVNPGAETEYERRHRPIWDDLSRVLKEHGAANYSIFLNENDNTLFAYVEIESEDRWAQVSETEACKRWWAFMADIMPHNADNSPKSMGLREVFHLA